MLAEKDSINTRAREFIIPKKDRVKDLKLSVAIARPIASTGLRSGAINIPPTTIASLSRTRPKVVIKVDKASKK